MTRVSLASRKIVGPSDDRDNFPAELNEMVAVKLWENPCWLSFRLNFLAHRFNNPIYDWVLRTFSLTRPEYMVIYALGLRDGVTAEDIVASSARPKNTMSRAVNSLLRRRLISRRQNETDRRRYHLHLSDNGRAILERTIPPMVARERLMSEALTPQERATLAALMTKLVLKSGSWPDEITGENQK